MPDVNILIGPYRSGKTDLLLSELVDSATPGPDPNLSGGLRNTTSHLIVPSSRYRKLADERIYSRLRKHMAENKNGASGLLGIKVDNFYNLCGQILKRSGTTFKLIPDTVRAAIVARAMNKLRAAGELVNLAPLADFKGTYGSVLELIDEFQRAGLSPDDVLSRLNKSASRSSKHVELARIYKRYWHELDEIGFLDSRRLAFSCREHLAARRDGDKLFGFVGVDGFDRFNRLQLDVLREISRFSENLTICFDYLKDIDSAAERQEYIWKESSFQDLISTFKDANLRWVQAPAATPATVSSIRAVDRYLEMEEVARSVKRSIVEDAVPPEDILLVVPNMRKYRSAIEAAFDDAGLPYFVDEAVALPSVPVVQFLFKLLTLFADEFSRGAVIAVLSNDHIKEDACSHLYQALGKVDDLSLDADLIGTRKQWMALNLDKPVLEDLESFFDALTPPEGMVPLTEFVSWAEDVVYRFLKPPEDIDHGDQFKEWLEDRALTEFRNCLGSLVQEDIVLNGGESGISMEYPEFIKHLEHVMEQSNFRSTSVYKKPVTICSVDLAPNRKFARVYLGGMVEGEFPRRAKARGFVSSDEIRLWSSYEGIDIDNPRLHPAFEYGLFQSLLKRAVEKVELTLPMWDMAGDEILPSFFITGGGLELAKEEVAPYRNSAVRPFSLKDFTVGATALGVKADRLREYRNPEIVDLVEGIADQHAMLIARLSGLSESNYNGCLTEQVSLGTLSVNMPEYWSATRLNEYGKCPFRYWVGQVMKLDRHEEPTLEIEPRLLGQTYHKALELFYQRIIDAKLDGIMADIERSRALFKDSLDEALAWLESESRVKDNQFWHYLKIEMEFRLNRFLEHELERESKAKIKFVPYRVEAPFGIATESGSQAPALVIADGDTKVAIRGFIDRIDIEQGSEFKSGSRPRLRVVDYKAGSSYISSAEAVAGRNLQMPIYMLAAEECVLMGAQPLEGVYLSISSGKSIGRVDFGDSDKRIAVEEAVRGHAIDFVRSIKRGDFSVAPNGSSVCDSCRHSLVCRISEVNKG
ncbi:MAG: exodeoxyribonuclease V subunit gamma [Candidatus Obscuribacterales bacterium]|nr:exodeoxyribonuclease V subunit gamma [Candidatus Obscuribacterales bacterium]